MTFTLSDNKGFNLYNGGDIKECIRIMYGLLSVDDKVLSRKLSFKSDLELARWLFNNDALLGYTLTTGE